MMPWFAVYDHTHYTRWGAVFITDKEHLAQVSPEVYQGFLEGDFVAKDTTQSFNQVQFDLRLEHINKTGKVAGGLVGITRTETARNRWSITYNERASLAEDTRALFGLEHEDDDEEVTHKDCYPSRIKRDNHDVRQLVCQFQRYHIFQEEHVHDLVSLATGDVTSEEIRKDLANGGKTSKELLMQFVVNRLVTNNTDFHDRLTKRKSRTFSSLYSDDAKGERLKIKSVKADRDIFRRIIVSMESGREVNIDERYLFHFRHQIAHYGLLTKQS